MKTFCVTVQCETTEQLKNALRETITEVESNEDKIAEWDVDVCWDITAGDAKEITLGRVE